LWAGRQPRRLSIRCGGKASGLTPLPQGKKPRIRERRALRPRAD
jgi:hypothetical protein